MVSQNEVALETVSTNQAGQNVTSEREVNGAGDEGDVQRESPALRVILETECSIECDGGSSGKQPESPGEGAVKPRVVRQFTWTERQGVSMMVPVSFGNVTVSAVVDTAAQITVISPDLRQKLKWVKPLNVEQVELCNAQKDAVMMGTLWPHVGFNLGGRKYYCDVIEADIHDSFILGIDFLRGHRCKVDLGNDILEFGNGDVIHAHMRSDALANNFHISRLVVKKKLSLPPNSVVYVNAKMESPAGVPFAFEPVDTLAKKKLFMMPGMVQGDQNFQVAVLNLADVHVKLRRNQELAYAVEVDAMLDRTSEKDEDSVLYVREDDQGKISVPQQYEVCQLRVTSGEHLDVVIEGPEQGDKDNVNGEDTGFVGGSLRDIKSPGYTGSSTSESNSHYREDMLPEHLKAMYEKAKNRLNQEQAEKLCTILIMFADVFAKNDLDLGKFTAIVHRIRTGDSLPIKAGLRRTPLGFESAERTTLDSMLGAGVIEPSQSEFAAAPVLVRKRDKSWRYCIDYRALNSASIRDVYPLPLIEECIDCLADKNWYCALDMNSGYWQIPLDEQDKHKTAFLTKYGLFQFTRMPFGLTNAPATFQRVVNSVLSGLIWSAVIVYLDDINVVGQEFGDTLANLVEVLTRFRQYGLKLKPRKCELFTQEVKFLGRRVNPHGIHVTDDHIQAVLEWPIPTCCKELESFLGFVNYHRSFITGLAGRAAILYELTGAPRKKWLWKENHTRAFEELKKAVTSASVLAFPNSDDHFILDTDASDFAIGAELSQVQQGVERTVSYASKSLPGPLRNYCTTRKELLAVLVFMRHYRHYLLGRHFTVRTDHASLVWIMRFKHSGGQLARWLSELSEYSFDIQHRSGIKHSNADGLSRIPPLGECDCYTAGKSLESLPCKGCHHCTRMHEQWRRFEEEVDDVVPLSMRSLTLTGQEDSVKTRLNGVIEELYLPFMESSNVSDIHQLTVFDTSGLVMSERGTDEGVTWDVRQIDYVPSGGANILPQYAPEELRDLQMQDPDLHPLFEWMDAGREPTQAIVHLSSPATRQMWRHRAQLEVIDRVLFYVWQESSNTRQLFVVPQKLKEEVLAMFHDSLVGGHMGRDKTLEKLRQRVYWYGMSTDVKVHVATCDTCNRNKRQTANPKAPLQSYQAGYPNYRVHLDILGPFCETPRGHKYVLMVIDQFTRFLELIPLKTQEADVMAKAFFEGYVVRFGVPFIVHTDQGRNFESEMFQVFCSLMEISKTRTTAYRPSSNGQVERYNQLVTSFLRCFLGAKHSEWDIYLPVLGMSIRSTVNRSTGFTPNFLRFGQEINLPVDIVFDFPGGRKQFNSPSEYLKHLMPQMAETFAEVRHNIKGAQRYQKKVYDEKARVRKFDVGDLVYRRNSAHKPGLNRKLCPLFSGPYLVVEVKSPFIYKVVDQKRNMILHHDKLRLCETRAIPFWVRRKRHEILGEPLLAETPENHFDQEDVIEERQEENRFRVEDDLPDQSDVAQDMTQDDEDSEGELELSSLFGSEPIVTRRGRLVKRPPHLRDYV